MQQVTLKCILICYRVANLTWGARVRVQCSGEERSAVCPAGVARMDGYLVKMEAAFEIMRGMKERREMCLKRTAPFPESQALRAI